MKLLLLTISVILLTFNTYAQDDEKQLERARYYISQGYDFMSGTIYSPTEITEELIAELYSHIEDKAGFTFFRLRDPKHLKIYFTSNFNSDIIVGLINEFLPKAELIEISEAEIPE